MARLKSGVLAVGLLPLVLAAGAAGRASAQTEHEQILNKFTTLLPTWSQLLPADQRFTQVLGSAGGNAILDQEAGLVWEK